MSNDESSAEKKKEKLRQKVRQLYAFLKEANQTQFRPVRNLSDQAQVIRLADIPRHPSSQLFRPMKTEAADDAPDILIRVALSAISRLVASRLNAVPGSESHLRSVLEVLDLKRLTSNAEIILGMAVRREFVAISDSSRQAN